MTAQQTDAITDPQSIIAALQQRLDAALSEKATLAEELAARDAALALRNSEFGERIEQQSATIDVLKVMSASPGDPQPVFELIVRRAAELCESRVGLFEFDGSMHHLRAMYGFEPDVVATYSRLFPQPLDLNGSHTYDRAVMERQIIHIRDIRADPVISGTVTTQMLDGSAVASIPLLRDGLPIGVIGMNGGPPGGNGFSESQIELLKTFAEQAVIAITSAETYRALQTRTSDLQESLEYQTATSDVLKVISRSTFDLQPVLDTLVETAARLCDADMAAIGRPVGNLWRLAANFGFPSDFEAYRQASHPLSPDSPTVAARAVREKVAVHIHDAAAVPGYPDSSIRLGKQRTSLGVPLLREGEVIGYIVLARQRVESFTDRQIELVSTFADQAVIAIENTRLLTEQQEALEQQTATAEVLQVINANPGDLKPVFEAMLEKAMRLCSAAIGGIYGYDGQWFVPVALRGVTPAFAAFSAEHPVPSGPRSAPTLILETKRPVQIPDLADASLYTSLYTRGMVDLGGIRALLDVPLLKEGTVLGFIAIYREEAGAFSNKEIALLENFAAQAVIAMENARLITEQREALEQQTATAEVLQVINASPGNLAPVFDTMLEKAMRLCEAAFGYLLSYDGEQFEAVAHQGLPPRFAEYLPRMDQPGPTGAYARILGGAPLVHVTDLMDGDVYQTSPLRQALVDFGGARTSLIVAIRREDRLLGIFTIYRREVRQFSDKQVALVESFAAQAAIAMENARLLTEQREALEQQTATAEVLQVINASPGNLQPVFDALLEKAMRLCEAALGLLLTYDGQHFHMAAHHGAPAAFIEFWEKYATVVRHGGGAARLLETKRPVQTLDMREAGEGYRTGNPISRALVDLAGGRTLLGVPLLKDGAVVGVILIYRREVRAFSDKQIALLENFAAQAVIAMENARLLDEIRRRQEELRITFENMGDGVAMFDKTPRLLAWNRKFQEIFDVPDGLLEEHRTYADYVRYLAERGEYGSDADADEHVRRLIEQAGQSRAYERTRPDGRVIEIRHNPVAGGGFVLIYADITERKRSEGEIRAARDAAETALRELKAAQANLIQAEKMASLGQLTAGIAHEIKNPLNFVNNFAALSVDLLGELKEAAAPGFAALTGDQRAEIEDVSTMLTSNLEKITEHGKRADGIVKAMLEHSRGSSAERRMVDLNALIDEALNLAYHGARAQDQSFNITLERDFDQGIAPIEVNPQDMTRVFLNIFSNGFYAATRRARNSGDAGFMPMLNVTTRDAGEVVEIRVRDNGTGIPAEIRDKLFQPFFTTKPTGEGTGLGLSITYDIVTKQHGGTITVDSEVNEFTEFVVTLPRQMFTNGGSRA